MEYAVNDVWDFVIPIAGSVIALFLIYVFYAEIWLPFEEQRAYIKEEVRRTSGEERKYWKRELRHFYLCHIPLIGFLFRRRRRHHGHHGHHGHHR